MMLLLLLDDMRQQEQQQQRRSSHRHHQQQQQQRQQQQDAETPGIAVLAKANSLPEYFTWDVDPATELQQARSMSVQDRICSMAVAATPAQQRLLLHLLLELATSSSSDPIIAETAMLAVNSISKKLQAACCSIDVQLVLAQPHCQWLLMKALASSNGIVSSAAADTLAVVWYNIPAYPPDFEVVPAFAATIQHAAAEVQRSGRLAAAAAELCWMASKRKTGPADLLLVHAPALLEAAASVQQQQQQQLEACQVFSLAALCNLRGREGEEGVPAQQLLPVDMHQLPPLLQIWLDHETLDDLAFATAIGGVLGEVVWLVRGLLQLLCCSMDPYLVAAAADALWRPQLRVLRTGLAMIERLPLQQQQQQAEGWLLAGQVSLPASGVVAAAAAALTEVTLEAGVLTGHALDAAAAVLAVESGTHMMGHAQQQQVHLLLAQLLLACAPDPAAFKHNFAHVSSYSWAHEGLLLHEAKAGQLWAHLLQAAPAQTRTAAVAELLQQAISSMGSHASKNSGASNIDLGLGLGSGCHRVACRSTCSCSLAPGMFCWSGWNRFV
jgi:hypothetical protein